jgi:hypothetical protein
LRMEHMTGSVVQSDIECPRADSILQCLPENYAPLLVENIKNTHTSLPVTQHLERT